MNTQFKDQLKEKMEQAQRDQKRYEKFRDESEEGTKDYHFYWRAWSFYKGKKEAYESIIELQEKEETILHCSACKRPVEIGEFLLEFDYILCMDCHH